MAKKVQEEKKELKVVNGYAEIIGVKGIHLKKDEVYKVTEEIANILIKKGVAKAK